MKSRKKLDDRSTSLARYRGPLQLVQGLARWLYISGYYAAPTISRFAPQRYSFFVSCYPRCLMIMSNFPFINFYHAPNVGASGRERTCSDAWLGGRSRDYLIYAHVIGKSPNALAFGVPLLACTHRAACTQDWSWGARNCFSSNPVGPRTPSDIHTTLYQTQ